MTECTEQFELFGKVGRARIEATFEGGDISSDAGGALLLRQAERRFGLLAAAARCLPDTRNPNLIRHTRLAQLTQRVFGIALGYEDLNDHEHLREDWALRTALGQRHEASSAPTLCRFENAMERPTAVALHGVLLEHFIRRQATAPTELILDLDATDDLVHGRQEGRFFHGYYDSYCFLPLYVFCGEELLVSYLRPANIDAAHHAAAVVKLPADSDVPWSFVATSLKKYFVPAVRPDSEAVIGVGVLPTIVAGVVLVPYDVVVPHSKCASVVAP